jgi:hypothetical protein
MRPEEPRYDVALSFAGEDRPYVEQVARSLADLGVKVFYDDYEKVALWGKDLYTHLDYVYREASRYCLIFISEDYARKVWTNHERSSAQARALEENQEYVLPVRFDATEVPGLRPTVGYLDIQSMKPEELARLTRDKLGPGKQVTPGFPTQIDRLYDALGLKGPRAKKAKTEARRVSYSFYDALRRMNHEERQAVAGAMAFGCAAELPTGVHVSLDFLSRMTGLPRAQLVECFSAVRSLNVKTVVRDPIHAVEDGELAGDDKDLMVSFWSSSVPGAKDPTKIVYQTVRCATNHFCADHGLEVITQLDFHRLSGAETGLLTHREESDQADHS